MNHVKRQISWFLMAIIVLASSVWYFHQPQKIQKLDNETLSSTIDATVVQLTVRQFDAKGNLVNVLRTPLLQHIPKDDVSLLQTPRIYIAQENQPAWEIQSQKAKSVAGGASITFMQQVIVHQNADEKTQESTLKTEEVVYYPKLKKATTDLLVTYEQPGNFIQSMGMNAYLDEKRVELLHQARGRYDPAKG